MLNEKELDELAENNWRYTEGIIQRMLTSRITDIQLGKDTLEIFHFIYIQAFKHGWKHREQE